jgi:hypothetical protein
MSWSVSAIGTKEELKAKMDTTFAPAEASYKQGTLEGDDVAACKARAVALVDALVVPSEMRMQVYGYGSHHSSSDGLLAGSFKLEVCAAPTP